MRDALSKVDATWFNFTDVTMTKPETKKKMSFVPEGGNWKDIPKPYNTYELDTHSCIMCRLKWDEPNIPSVISERQIAEKRWLTRYRNGYQKKYDQHS